MIDPVSEPLLSLIFRLAVAFGIGAIIGLEREQSESGGSFAGSRTFPLFALFGALVQVFFPSLLAVALAAIALSLTLAYAGKIWIERDIGLTTVSASLLTVVLGAMTTHSDRGLLVAVIVGGTVTAVLSAKDPIHEFADRIDASERRASVQFILVALVVFPVLPNRELDVLLGLNPRVVWFMVVLVSGLSFVAYLLSRVFTVHRGIAVTGVLGGFVSSTATAVSMAERTANSPELYRICGFATVAAAIVMFPRALVEVAFVNPQLLSHVIVPLGSMTVVGALVAAYVYWRSTTTNDIDLDVVENPFQLKPALFFGVVFAVVLLVSKYANELLGSSGVYATAFLSGLADIDAITLSLSSLAADGAISTDVAATGIVIAAIANTLVKAGLALALGTRQLGRVVIISLGVVMVVGLLAVL
ncbi:MAG: MgtC/SapB family protein [Halobacteriota archaeon]